MRRRSLFRSARRRQPETRPTLVTMELDKPIQLSDGTWTTTVQVTPRGRRIIEVTQEADRRLEAQLRLEEEQRNHRLSAM